jgi:hypothetical protein
MHVDRRFLNWGVFLVLAGAVPLAVRSGYLTSDQVASWWTFWPLILVGLGVGLVLSRTPLEFLGGLVVAGTFGLMAGGLISGGGFSGAVCTGQPSTTPLEQREGSFSGEANVTVKVDCGSLKIATAPGDGWAFEGTGDDRGPPITADGSSLSIGRDDRGAPFGLGDGRDTWRVVLPEDIPWALDVEVNAGSATVAPGAATLRDVVVGFNASSVALDLGAVTAIDELDVEGNAGSASITLPSVSLTGSLQANAGSIEICAPPGAALRFRGSDDFAESNDFGQKGLVQNGSTWESPGYDAGPIKIDLQAQANAGSFTLNPEDGCGG